MVCVETIAFLCCSSANRTDGTRYPSDLPTPVPASTTKCCSSCSACATRAAISCCSGRNSKFFALESGPFWEKKPRTRSINSLPRLFFSAIISDVPTVLAGNSPVCHVERRRCNKMRSIRPGFQTSLIISSLTLKPNESEIPRCAWNDKVGRSGIHIVIRQSQIEIRKSHATSGSLRHSKFRAGLCFMHRRIHLDLAHLRCQRQYFDLH